MTAETVPEADSGRWVFGHLLAMAAVYAVLLGALWLLVEVVL